MTALLIILVLLLMAGGGFYAGAQPIHLGGGLGTVLVVVLVLYLLGVI